MKTAISIPENIFKKVNQTAKKMGLTRSRLLTIAAEEFIENHNHSQILEKLNSIYEKESSKIDSNILQMQVDSIGKEDW